MAVAFDTLAYARKLRQAGVPEEQAQVHAEALAAVVTETLATKQDLRELEYRLTLRLGAMLTVSGGAVGALGRLACSSAGFGVYWSSRSGGGSATSRWGVAS